MSTDENTFRRRVREERRTAVSRLAGRAEEVKQAKEGLAYAEEEHAMAEAALADIKATYEALGMEWPEAQS